MADLKVEGVYEPWHGAAWRGTLTRDDVTAAARSQAVLVLLGPEGGAAEGVARARLAAGQHLGLQKQGILPLIEIQAHENRVAWVHSWVEGIGLGHVAQGEGAALLPARVVAELVAAVADTLLRLDPEMRRNRGPEPTDILLDATGAVSVSGFSSPYATSPAMRAPRSEEGDTAAVYRLGVLMSHLVSGAPPSPASEKAAHQALVRRALIRAMARPGPVLSERYGDWMRALLAWEPTERPPLSTIPDGLRQVAASMGGPDLPAWAAANIPTLRTNLLGALKPSVPGPMRKDDDSTELARTEEAATADVPRVRQPNLTRAAGYADPTADAPRSPPGRPRAEIDAGDVTGNGFQEDDPTQEAGVSQTPAQPRTTSPNSRPPGSIPSMMPIRVGPPPEAIKEPPSLPTGFLDDVNSGEEGEPPPANPWVRLLVAAVWVASILVLFAVALLFLIYLLLPPPGPVASDADPGLSDALPHPIVEDTDPPPAPPREVLPGPGPEEPEAPVPEFEIFPAPPDGTITNPIATDPPEPAIEVTPIGTDPADPPTRPTHPPAHPTDAPLVFDVGFSAGDPRTALRIECNVGSVEGVGSAIMKDTVRGPCTVTGRLDGKAVKASVALSGPTHYTCFVDGSSSCVNDSTR